jgi:hypothetical protein
VIIRFVDTDIGGIVGQRLESEIILKSFGSKKPKGLNRLAYARGTTL